MTSRPDHFPPEIYLAPASVMLFFPTYIKIYQDSAGYMILNFHIEVSKAKLPFHFQSQASIGYKNVAYRPNRHIRHNSSHSSHSSYSRKRINNQDTRNKTRTAHPLIFIGKYLHVEIFTSAVDVPISSIALLLLSMRFFLSNMSSPLDLL